MWGVVLKHNVRHVVPVDEDEYVLAPHVLNEGCPCRPRIDDDGIVIHGEIPIIPGEREQ